MMLTSRVPQDRAGYSISGYIAQRFTYHTPDEWRLFIREKKILINGQPCTEDQIVKNNDSITYVPDDFTEPPADLNFTIVYEDDWMLGINKPGNLLVHRAGKSFTTNLMYQLRYGRGRTFTGAGAVNRLDRETSGVVLVAKENRILTKLQDHFKHRTIEKEYVAVVHGWFDPTITSIEKPIGPDTASANRSRHRVDEPAGKPAITRVCSVRPLGDAYSVVVLQPLTGRTHQIRVHCAYLGHPIAGDWLYGDIERGKDVIARQALHCLKVTFEHPFTKRTIVIEAPVPEDIRKLIDLEAYR
jgi:RluA family pseudouridine synthase